MTNDWIGYQIIILSTQMLDQIYKKTLSDKRLNRVYLGFRNFFLRATPKRLKNTAVDDWIHCVN
jgi:hypothetical protein